MGVCVYLSFMQDINIEIYGKELAFVIMESEKSQDLEAASWKPTRADA